MKTTDIDNGILRKNATNEEYLKQKRASEIFEEYSEVLIPRIEKYDFKKQHLYMNYFENAKNLSYYRYDHDKYGCLLFKAGKSLNYLHSYPENTDRVGQPTSLKCNIHGDYTVDNVLFDLEKNSLVLIDWSMAPWIKKSSNIQIDEQFEIIWMLVSIYCLYPFYLSSKTREYAACCFVDGYFNGSVNLDKHVLEKTIVQIDILARSNLRATYPLFKRGLRKLYENDKITLKRTFL